MRENPHFPSTVCEASFPTLTLARISTVRVNVKAASIIAPGDTARQERAPGATRSRALGGGTLEMFARLLRSPRSFC